jgi:hypothetical protein
MIEKHNRMKLIKVKQSFPRQIIPDDQIEEHVRQQIRDSGLTLQRGSQIAIAVGSRGIANIARIVKVTVETIKEMGGVPFIVPAMGSHGGATAKGQRKVLEGYGITETYVGAPIKSSMGVIELPQEGLENRVFMDKYASEADGTIIINRIKLHTDYHGPFESGLMKMCVIGLGKHKGALEIHQHGTRGLKDLIPPTARQVLKHGNILLGIAIAENAYDETAIIKALLPSQIEEEEQNMLAWVRANMPSLPVRQLDVLIIDEFGKDISGVGLDPNIIGRTKIRTEPEPTSPNITSILLLDLTEKSHGNAIGIGLADVITRNVFEKVDFQATYENVVTSSFLERGFMPIVAENARIGLDYALRSCGLADPANPRIIRIKNTLTLDQMWVSRKVLEEIRPVNTIEVTGETRELFPDSGLRIVQHTDMSGSNFLC